MPMARAKQHTLGGRSVRLHRGMEQLEQEQFSIGWEEG